MNNEWMEINYYFLNFCKKVAMKQDCIFTCLMILILHYYENFTVKNLLHLYGIRTFKQYR